MRILNFFSSRKFWIPTLSLITLAAIYLYITTAVSDWGKDGFLTYFFVYNCYITSLILTLAGITFLKESLETKAESIDWTSPLQGYIRGWAAGIGFLILGPAILILHLLGKL